MAQQAIEFNYHFCPQCGASNPSVGGVPFRCTVCGFANFFGPVAAVGGLIVNDAGQVLLVRRARDPGKGMWGLPGGFVDRGETIEQALCREIDEETQLRVTQLDYLTSHPNTYCYHGVIASVVDLFYVCRVDPSQPLKLAADELEHFEWTRPTAEQLNHMAFHSNRVALELWMKKQL